MKEPLYDESKVAQYMKLPKTLLRLSWVIPGAAIMIAMIGKGHLPMYAIEGLLMLESSIVILPMLFGLYHIYATSIYRSQKITYLKDGSINYRLVNGQSRYHIKEVYDYKVTNRFIKIIIEDKYFPLRMARTIIEEERFLEQLRMLKEKTDQENYEKPNVFKMMYHIVTIPFVILTCIWDAIRDASVEGTLEGFVEIDGNHYPSYTFVTKDGQIVQTINRSLSIEESTDSLTAARIIRRKYPKKTTVYYRKKNPSKCYSKFL